MAIKNSLKGWLFMDVSTSGYDKFQGFSKQVMFTIIIQNTTRNNRG
jgi:hypothetical protein